jgi:hypothetical protein
MSSQSKNGSQSWSLEKAPTPPTADWGPWFTNQEPGGALSLPHLSSTSSSSLEVRTGHRVWLNLPAAGAFPVLSGGSPGPGSSFGAASEMLRGLSFTWKENSGTPSPAHHDLWLGLICLFLPLYSLPMRTSKHICAQVKAGGGLPGLQPDRAGSNLAKVEQCQGQVEVRSLSQGKPSGFSLPLFSRVQWRRGESLSHMADKLAGSPEVSFTSLAWKEEQGSLMWRLQDAQCTFLLSSATN